MASRRSSAPASVTSPVEELRVVAKPNKKHPSLRRDLEAARGAADATASDRRIVSALLRYLPEAILDAPDPDYDPTVQAPVGRKGGRS